jgi:acyl-CoA reductase-like NAD-dependent aldehyde dehydrogenase
MGLQRTFSPVDGRVYAEPELATAGQIEAALAVARRAQACWRGLPVEEGCHLLGRAVDLFVAREDAGQH